MSTSTTNDTTANNTDSKSPTKDDEDRFWIKVSENIPSLEECYAWCAADASCGAVSTFVGITRNNFNGKRVQKLSYEGYVAMAEKEMHKLCVEATSGDDDDDDADAKMKFPSVQRIAMVHILGDCPVGRASVIIAAASPHRIEAMHCTEFLINELKARIPIWKKEVYDDDEAGYVWKENVEWHQGRQRRVMVKQEEEEVEQN